MTLLRSWIRKYHAIRLISGTTGITLQGTDDQWVPEVIDLLSNCPARNAITVTVDGAVTMRVWKGFEDLADGQSRTFYPNEVADGYLRAVTSGALPGDATWTFEYHTGANDTGPLETQILEWNIQSYPRLTYLMGTRTPAWYGGFPVHKLPGTAAQWAISSQSTSNAFQIVTDSGATDKAWLCWAGASYGGTRTITSPTVGTAAYTVTLANSALGTNTTVTFDTSATVLNARPAPGRDVIIGGSPTSGSHQISLLLGTASLVRFGDTILAESGTYINLDRPGLSTPTTGAGGETAPTGPFVGNSWDENGNRATKMHTSWRTVKSREPLTVYTAHSYSVQGLPGYAGYLRMTGFEGRFSFYNGLSNVYKGVCIDHCKHSGINIGNRDTQEMLFALDNYGNGGIGVVGKRVGLAGNCFKGIPSGDIVQMYAWDEAAGYSFCSWNFSTDKSRIDGDHPDSIQFLLNGSNVPALVAFVNAGGTKAYLPRVIGNIFNRGNGNNNSLGAPRGTQQFFMGDYAYALNYVYQIGGNISVELTSHAFWAKFLDEDSQVRNNSWLQDVARTPAAEDNTPPYIAFNKNDARNVGGAFDLSYNICNGLEQNSHTSPVSTDNILNFNGSVAYASHYTNSTYFDQTTTIGEFLARWEPTTVTGGFLRDGSGNPRTRIIGATGDRSLIDHRCNYTSATFWS